MFVKIGFSASGRIPPYDLCVFLSPVGTIPSNARAARGCLGHAAALSLLRWRGEPAACVGRWIGGLVLCYARDFPHVFLFPLLHHVNIYPFTPLADRIGVRVFEARLFFGFSSGQ